MRIVAQFKKEYKYFQTTIVYLLGTFIAVPIVLGLLYGALYEKMVSPDIKLEPITIYIAEKDEDIYLPAVRHVLNAEGMYFIRVSQVEPNEVNKMAEEDKAGLGLREVKKQVEIINYGPSSTEKDIVVNLVMPLVDALSYGEDMTAEEQTKFIHSYFALSQKDLVDIKDVIPHKKLTSYQLMLMSVYSAMSFFIAITFATNFLKERESAVMRRLFSIDINQRAIYLNTVLAIFSICLIMVMAYSLIVYKLILKAEIPIMNLLLVNVIHAGFLASLYGFFIGIFRTERMFKIYCIPLIMVIMVLGGSFFPIDMFPNPAGYIDIMPNYNLLKLYEGLMILTTREELIYRQLTIVATMLVLAGVGLLKFTTRGAKSC